jgi:hypothetical protein
MGLPDVEELKYLIECPSASAISLKDLETFYDNVLEGEGFFSPLRAEITGIVLPS